MRRALFKLLATVYPVLIFGGPLAMIVWFIQIAGPAWLRAIALVCAPFIFSALLVVVAGALSLPHQKHIKPGRMRRKLDNTPYFHRRVYGLCWTTVYYCTPAYYICLGIPVLKWLTFRLFGYRGSMDFTIYPDTWIRDLPLLHFGDGVYVSNRATLGTNLVLGNNILVDRITLDKNALVGHLAMLCPGVHVGEGAEIGGGAGLGISVRVGARSTIGPLSGVESGAEIGDDVQMGSRTFVSAKAKVANGTAVPRAGYVSPERQEAPYES